jgi:phosphinothricin acetyltransferase
MPTLRPATRNDAPALAAILAAEILAGYAHFGTTPPSVFDLTREIEESGAFPFLVAELTGAVVGFARATPWKTRGAYAWTAEVGVYVAPGQQGRGLGRALLAAVVDEARARGFRTLLAGIALPNPASVALCEGLGFQRVGVLPRVGFKQGAWRDVGYWARTWADEPPGPPP